MATNSEKVLEVKDLVVSFKTDRGIVKAVRGVSFDLYKGETLCIVGESGSGKSVTNKAVMGISSNNAIIESGSILYEGEDLIRVSEEEFHRIRGHKIGMIFQDPLSALNPVMRIGKQIIEATMINKNMFKRKFAELVAKELTAYRNNEADYNYNVTKIHNRIAKNNKRIEEYENAVKLVGKYEAAIAKANGNEAKLVPLTKEKAEWEEKIATFKYNHMEDGNSYAKANARDAQTIHDLIEKYKKNETTTDLEKQINDELIAKNEAIVEFMSRPEYSAYTEDIVDSLTKQNAVLKEFEILNKEWFKKTNPALKENYNLAKKNAKVEVKEYKDKITQEHNDKVAEINAKIAEANNALATYKASLDPTKVSEIDEIISYNEELKKKREKAAKNFKENSISKVVKQTEDFKEIPDAKYAELYQNIQKANEELVNEKELFISKTVITKAQAKKMAIDVMREVGIPMPEKRFKQYPFEFSGGMRQRIVIAIALTANPEILICDEPTTALDVTIQAQILELINRLKKERNLSCIFITHDLGVVANMADRVAVMYAGKIVEYGTANEVFFEPKHPYTWALLSSIPDVDSKEKLEAIPGTPPDMIYPPKGDAFALRSKYAIALDFKSEPPYFKVSETHYAATWLLHPDAPKVEMPRIVSERIKNALKNGGKVDE